jgi:hypothetical protein
MREEGRKERKRERAKDRGKKKWIIGDELFFLSVFFSLNFGVEFFFYLLENSKVVSHASLLTVIYPRRSKGLA